MAALKASIAIVLRAWHVLLLWHPDISQDKVSMVIILQMKQMLVNFPIILNIIKSIGKITYFGAILVPKLTQMIHFEP